MEERKTFMFPYRYSEEIIKALFLVPVTYKEPSSGSKIKLFECRLCADDIMRGVARGLFTIVRTYKEECSFTIDEACPTSRQLNILVIAALGKEIEVVEIPGGFGKTVWYGFLKIKRSVNITSGRPD